VCGGFGANPVGTHFGMRALPVLLVLALAGGWAFASPGAAAAGTPACGARADQRPAVRHVIVIVMENRSYSDVIGRAPYITRLARHCGLATNYHATAHPSLPNYLAMTSGSTHGIASDCSPAECAVRGRSIFSQAAAHHLGWRSYAQSMPAACDTASGGLYAARHVPAVYYLGLRADCRRHVRRLGRLGSGHLHDALNGGHAPAYIFVTPNMCNDMHDCPASAGDRWASRWIRMMRRSRTYRAGHTAILLTWDEDDGSAGNRVPLVVVSPYTPAGRTSSRPLNHYSLLRASEHLLGIRRFLGDARRFSGLGYAFHL
jgi:phosphatidylinositol-3-phosphatase